MNAPRVRDAQLEEYEALRRALAGERLPCAVVRLEAFDRNVERCLAPLEGSGKTLRLATKSLRVPALIERVLARGGARCRGVMAFSAEEAVWLTGRGVDDVLVAYPTLQRVALEALARAAAEGRRARIVVDSRAHLEALARAAEATGGRCEGVIELDVSWRPVGRLHVGVRRSPLRDAEAVLALAREAEALGVPVSGLMAYEAHVAGLTDSSPYHRVENPLRRALKQLAMPRVAALRAEVVERLRAAGVALDLVNAGGTGSLSAAVREPALTEVTAGSAFLAPHLFDYYAGLRYEPAALFACEVVRASDPGLVTCHGGGYVASGAPGSDRLPRPWLPPGLELVPLEGAGEVQTPLVTLGCRRPPIPGEPVFFRHAKAGELMERFAEVLLVEGERVVERAPTYRGLGLCFL